VKHQDVIILRLVGTLALAVTRLAKQRFIAA
jgi:hypothetical protein